MFNVERKVKGNDSIGLQEHCNVYDLRIPAELESRREEIKQLIRESLEEATLHVNKEHIIGILKEALIVWGEDGRENKYALYRIVYFRPFADGGTRANPNITVRGNIVSFEVEFK